MEIFLFALKLLAMDLVPVILIVIVHILFNKIKVLKNLNYWWKQLIIGSIFAALCIVSYVVSIKVQINSRVSYVGNGTAIPLLTCLIFGWPAGCLVAVVGALYRGLAFADFLRWPVVISLLLSAVVGTLTRIFLYQNKRTKWYNAALTGIFVETINFLLIFIFSRDTSDAFNILSVIDAICIVGSALMCSLSIICLNLVDVKILKVQNYDKNTSHSISTKIQHRLFIVTSVTLIVVSTSTFVISSRKSIDDICTHLNLTHSNMVSRFDLRFAVNTYYESTGGTYPYEYHTICTGQTILDKGYPIIVSNNGDDINDITGTYKDGQIISTNEVIADRKQYSREKFQFDDGTTCSDRNPNDYSTDKIVKLLKVKVNKIDYYCSIFPAVVYGAYDIITPKKLYVYLVCLANAEEVNASVGISLKIAIYTEILAFLFLFATINLLLRKIVINKIYQVNNSLEKITNGDLNEVVNATGSKEIERLSSRINLTVDSLKLYAKKVEQKMEEDLALAKKIQTTSVPTLFPLVKHYEIFATMHTAKEVGGDFYDYVTIDDNHVLFLVADVSGKGIPAALFMMRAKTLIKSLVSTGIPLEYVVKRANDELCNENTAGLFVTMWIGILDTRNGKVTYVNCGHCLPIVRLDGQYSFIRTRKNFVLGAIDGFDFKSDTLTLGIDDVLFLYTDGVTEATNKNLELYGEDRLLKFISNSSAVFDCHQMLDRLNEEIDRYQKDVEQADDITMLALKYRGNSNDSESKEITLRSRNEDTTAAINFVKTFMYKNRADENKIKEVTNAVDEVFTNIVKYAYPRRIGYVKIKVEINNKVISITFIDKGGAFDPTKGVGKNKKTGLGLLIIKKCVDKMTYTRNRTENVLILEKNI